MAIPKNARTVKVSEVDQDTARKNVEVIGKDQDAPFMETTLLDFSSTDLIDITNYWWEGEFTYIKIPKIGAFIPGEILRLKCSCPFDWTPMPEAIDGVVRVKHPIPYPPGHTFEVVSLGEPRHKLF